VCGSGGPREAHRAALLSSPPAAGAALPARALATGAVALVALISSGGRVAGARHEAVVVHGHGLGRAAAPTLGPFATIPAATTPAAPATSPAAALAGCAARVAGEAPVCRGPGRARRPA